METKANYIVTGAFTLAVIVGAFGFIYWFQNTGSSGPRSAYRVVFDGSVSGLRTGASVTFNGIRVGEVSELALDANNPRKVDALIMLDRAVPVRADTKVRSLISQGLHRARRNLAERRRRRRSASSVGCGAAAGPHRRRRRERGRHAASPRYAFAHRRPRCRE